METINKKYIIEQYNKRFDVLKQLFKEMIEITFTEDMNKEYAETLHNMLLNSLNDVDGYINTISITLDMVKKQIEVSKV